MLSPRPNFPSSRSGFALLITILLVSFLVLILVTLAVLTRVETTVATNSQQLDLARQNALTALNVALGELQKYAGPDQRATARADIDESAGTVSPGARQWTGVWANTANPQTGMTSSPLLLQWMVSGNHRTDFRPDTGVDYTAAGFGRVITPPSAAPEFAPGQDIVGLNVGMTLTDPVTIGGEDAVLLLGPGSAGSAAGRETDYVVAPLVDINIPASLVPGAGSDSDPQRVGRYAYWVGDESTKARVNLVDPYANPTPQMIAAGNTAETASPLRLMAPQRLGIERVAGFENYPVNDDKLRKIIDDNQAAFALPGLAPGDRQAAVHDLTTFSQSVISDALRGGLKRDLTHAFARDDLNEYRAIIRDPMRALSTTAPNPLLSGVLDPTVTDNTVTEAALLAENGPTWEQLRDHARLGAEIDTTTDPRGRITPRVQTGTELGVYPILVQARLGFLGGKVLYDAPEDPRRFVMRYSPVFVLANPYNVTLAASKYRVRLAFSNASAGYGIYIGPGKGIKTAETSPTDRKSLRELFEGHVYELDCPDIAPGQARLFTLSRDYDWQATAVYECDNEWAETFVSVPTAVEISEAELSTKGIHAVWSDNGLQKHWREASGTIESSGATPVNMTWALTDESDRIYQRFDNVDSQASGASVYDQGYWGASDDDDQVRGFLFFKLAETGNFRPLTANSTPLTQIQIYPYYALHNLRAPVIARPKRYDDLGYPSNLDSAVIFSQAFQKSASRTVFQRWVRFGPSDPLSDAQVEWQGVRRDGYGTSAAALPQALLNWPMADIPRATAAGESGLVSIGQLQHFNAGGYNEGSDVFPAADFPLANRPDIPSSWRPRHVGRPHPVGNSHAEVFVRRELVRTRQSGEPYHDRSYLLNRQLFDGYFFSTFPQRSGSTFDFGRDRLANTNLVPFREEIAGNDTAAYRGGPAFDADDVFLPARNLMLRGGFNVNSTSVAAWRALLGALAGAELNGETGLTGPFPRSVRQPAGSQNAADGVSEDSWNGFRNLTSAQIDALAAAIVAQIKQRGVSLGLADFINRKLVLPTAANAADGLAGPIQAAIDATDINDGIADEMQNWDDATVEISELRKDHALYTGTIAGTTGHVEHLPAHPLDGIAGWLTQADIVQALAPLLTSRGDTFRIRTYGEVRNPATDEVTGRAWCEAVVQREPDYIDDAADDAAVIPALLSSDENRRFGRQFKITKFRWLTPDEI